MKKSILLLCLLHQYTSLVFAAFSERDNKYRIVSQLAPSMASAALDDLHRLSEPDIRLHLAAILNQENQLKKALREGAEVNSVNERWSKRTPLHLAAVHFCTPPRLITALLRAKANVNAQDAHGRTALHYAVDQFSSPHNRKRIHKIMKTFIKGGADLTIKDNNDRSPLNIAQDRHGYDSDNLPVVGILSNATRKQMRLAAERQNVLNENLRRAALLGDQKQAHDALAKGANINSPDFPLRYTPLHYATNYFQSDMVKYLLAEKANVDAQNHVGDTALHIIIGKASKLYPGMPRAQILKTLINAHPNLAITEKNGWTALKYAEFQHRKGEDAQDFIEILRTAEKEQKERKVQMDA